MEISVGQEFEVKFPFVMSSYVGRDIDEEFSDETWIPGCNSVPLYPDDCEWVADDVGKMTLTVVDIHKPGKYPERVFYTRQWEDPDGKVFGAKKLHITTTPTFKRRAAGYYYEYRVKE